MNTPQKLNFPEGVDESRISALLKTLLDAIDREHLFQDQRLTRVRHPLLSERMGRDTALNTEIHNLVTDLVNAWSFSMQPTGEDEFMLKAIPRIEKILLDSAKDPDEFREILAALKEVVTNLAKLNPEETGAAVESFVSDELRQQLTMPSAAQELMLYPPVTIATLGGSQGDISRVLEKSRDMILTALDGATDSDSVALRALIETEAVAVRAWFEKAAI